jgi:predicted dehydrogenase
MSGAGHVLRIGIIGAGAIGHTYADGLRASSAATISRVFDPDDQRADGFAQASGAPRLGLDVLCETSDAVIITSPAQTQGPLSLMAFDHGCHVLVERPFSTSRMVAEEMIQKAQALKLVLHAGHDVRPLLGGLGLLGKASGLRSLSCVREAPGSDILDAATGDASVVTELMIQDLYAAAVLFGTRPVSVRATKLGGRGAILDAVEARIRFKGGGEAHFRASKTASLRTAQWMIEGAQGQMSVDFIRGALTHSPTWPDPLNWSHQDLDAISIRLQAFVLACQAPWVPIDHGPTLTALDLAQQVETIVRSSL